MLGFGARRLKGYVSTRMGVFTSGFKTKFEVDVGLQDVIVPISEAQVSGLSSRNIAAIYIQHSNAYNSPQVLPPNLRYLEQNQGGAGSMLPGGLARRVLIPPLGGDGF